MNQQKCVICMDEVMTDLIVPCNHFCLCETCAFPEKQKLEECPICRGPVEKISKIFCAGIVEDSAPDLSEKLGKEEKEVLLRQGLQQAQEVENLRAQAAALRQQLQQAQASKTSEAQVARFSNCS